MTGQGTAETTGGEPGRGWPRALQILGVVLGLFIFVSNVELIAGDLGHDLFRGSIGGLVDPDKAVDGAAPVTRIDPNGALAKAGVKVGDVIRFDHPMDSYRVPRPGELIGFSLQAGGRWIHQTVRAEGRPLRRPDQAAGAWLVYDLATFFAGLIGMFIIWRGGGALTAMLLGFGLTFYGYIFAIPTALFSARAIYPIALTVAAIPYTAIPWCFYAFALAFYRDQGGARSKAEVIWLGLFGAVLLPPAVALQSVLLTLRPLPLLGDGTSASAILTFLGFAICLIYLGRGWRRASPEARQRYALLILATAAILFCQFMDTLATALHFPGGAFRNVHLIGNAVLAGVASGLYAYAILRQKVFDLGLAVNRTLVYGVVSAVLLAGFGLVEWAADHFLPIAGREKNALIDAGVALAIFLTFHRLRDGAERVIETLFFRAWREKEETLKAFLAEAPYFTGADALMRAAIRSISHYAEGAEMALYLPGEDGAFRRVEGRIEGLGARIEADDGALVALRARRQSLDGAPLVSLPGAALALPMLNRAEVTGVVLIAPKPTGLAFRPDEIAILSDAVRGIGQDLHALKVERLEALAERLAIEKAALAGRGDVLRAAG
jgi:hypothetical protein